MKDELKSKEVQSIPAMNKITGKYTIKISPLKKSWIANTKQDTKEGETLFSRTFIDVCPEIDRSTGLTRTGLTQQLEAELETAMNLRPGTLSRYNKVFWADHKNYLKISSDGTEINCDRSAKDKLIYCYLMDSTKVAKSYAEAIENPLCEFMMISEEAEIKVEANRVTNKRKAYKALEDMSVQEQIDFLSVYKSGAYKVSTGATPDFAVATLGKIVDEDPNGFMGLITDPYYKEYVFLRRLISAGFIRTKGYKYYTIDGSELGSSFEDAVAFLARPENSALKVSFLAKLEEVNKK